MHLRLVCVDGRTSLFLILIFFHFSALRINVGFEVLVVAVLPLTRLFSSSRAYWRGRYKVKDSQSTLVLDLSAPTTSAGTYATNNNALKPRSASLHRVVKEGEEGLYSLVFARCFDAGPSGLDASHISVRECMHALLLHSRGVARA